MWKGVRKAGMCVHGRGQYHQHALLQGPFAIGPSGNQTGDHRLKNRGKPPNALSEEPIVNFGFAYLAGR